MSARRIWGIAGWIASTIILSHPATALAAARVYLDPATAAVASGSQTNVKLMIDAGNEAVLGADAKILFPKAIIEVVSVTAGTFFSGVDKVINAQAGSVEIHGYISSTDADDSKTGTGVIATLLVKGIAPGTASLTIPCSAGVSTDANIVDATGNDIISCALVTGSALTITQSVGDGLGSSTPTPTPSSLPQAGNATAMVSVLAFGFIFLTGGMIMVARENKY